MWLLPCQEDKVHIRPLYDDILARLLFDPPCKVYMLPRNLEIYPPYDMMHIPICKFSAGDRNPRWPSDSLRLAFSQDLKSKILVTYPALRQLNSKKEYREELQAAAAHTPRLDKTCSVLFVGVPSRFRSNSMNSSSDNS